MTGTAIPRPNGRSVDKSDIYDFMYGQKATFAADQAFDLSIVGKTQALSSLTTGDKVFTLPDCGAGQDGELFIMLNSSYHNLRVRPYQGSDSKIWNSGPNYGVDLPDKGTMVVLQFRFAENSFDILSNSGRVLVEGLVLQMPFDKMNRHGADDLTRSQTNDLTLRHNMRSFNGISIGQESVAKFPPSCWVFGGVDEYGTYPASPDWDIVAVKTGHATAACWIRHDNVTSSEYYVTHREDSSNRWEFYITASRQLALIYATDGGTGIAVNSGASLIANTTWTHVALIRSAGGIGLYIDGVQVVWVSADWYADTNTGGLNIAQQGDDSNFFGGRIQDLHISYNDIYGVTPNVGLTGHFPNLEQLNAPFVGVLN
jgi:hypothetical protein